MSDKFSDTFLTVKGEEHSQLITLKQLSIIQKATKKDPELELVKALRLAGFVDEETQLKVAEILSSWSEAQSSKKKQPSRRNKQSLGDSLSTILASLNNTEMCLCLSNFNTITAFQLYCEEDFRIVLEAYSLWSQMQMTELSNNFEIAVVAAGGSLKKSKDHVITKSEDIKAGEVISF